MERFSVSEGLGSRLAEVLADQRLTQMALAARLKSSSGFISAVVRGLKAPGADFLASLSDTLGVSVDWLLSGRGSKYGGAIDAELLQNLVLQVRLARLAMTGTHPEAAVLLKNALPDLDLGQPSVAVGEQDAKRLLETLAEQNEDVAVAISIFNNYLLQVPRAQRGTAINKALQELVQSKRRPSILNLMRASAPAESVGGRPKAEDNINWVPEDLPPGRKVGDVLEQQKDSSEHGEQQPGVKRRTRRAK